MATLNEMVQAYQDFIGERSATVGAFLVRISKAESALLGKIPGQVKENLDALKKTAGAITCVRDMRGFDKNVERVRGELWQSISDTGGLLDHNKGFAYGRAKRTHEDALNTLTGLGWRLDEFFKAISTDKEAQDLEQWMIDNNRG